MYKYTLLMGLILIWGDTSPAGHNYREIGSRSCSRDNLHATYNPKNKINPQSIVIFKRKNRRSRYAKVIQKINLRSDNQLLKTIYKLDIKSKKNKMHYTTTENLGVLLTEPTKTLHEKERQALEYIVKSSIRIHKDLDAKDEKWEQKTLLLKASILGSHQAIADLVTAGATVDLPDDDSRTPLFWAVYHNHITCVHNLLHANANINYKDRQGRTVLHWAAFWGHSSLISLLLEHGAIQTTTDNNNQTPLELAQHRLNKVQTCTAPEITWERNLAHTISLLS